MSQPKPLVTDLYGWADFTNSMRRDMWRRKYTTYQVETARGITPHKYRLLIVRATRL